MASTPSNYRINQIAKDFNIKSKEILEVFSKKSGEKTHMTVLEPDEFDFLVIKLTDRIQLNNIDDYLSGKSVIELAEKKEKKDKNSEQEQAGEQAAEKQEQLKNDEAVDKTSEPSKPAPDEKVGVQNSGLSEKAKDSRAEGSKVEPKEGRRERESAQPRPERTEKQDTADARSQTGVRADGIRPQQKNDFRGQAQQRPGGSVQQGQQRQNGTFPQGQNQGQRDRFNRNERTQPGTAGPQFRGNSQNSGQNSGNGRPGQNQWQQGQGGGQSSAHSRPSAPFRGEIQSQPAKPTGPKAQKAENRPQSTIGPKPKIVIERGAATRTGGKRVIDTRSGDVDLSKYDERFEHLAFDAVKDKSDRSDKQKIKKKSGNGKNSAQDKEKLAIERMKKMELEKARKAQLHITVPAEISVGELASRLKVTAGDLIKRLMKMGIMASVNQIIDYDTAFLVADEMNVKVTQEVVVTIEERLFEEESDDESKLVERPPVVVVMGHVDHGKTSLLDAIRHTNVTEGEAGGITQHIGAYRVTINGKDITFLDTPGHEAFTAMRARGAMATDIAILVVAADDGIMPQTVEAINHAKAAGVDIIVAINKMDKPAANPDLVMQGLTQYDLVPEEWGGDVICVPVSAVTRMGIDSLLENILLVAEMKELKANPDRHAKGIVIEAKLDKGRGPVATVLVQNGTLRSGDIVIAGTSVGRVRAMLDDKGAKLTEAGPSVPVEIIGLSEVPSAGDEFNAVEDERMARELAEQRRSKAREDEFKANSKVNLEDLFSQISEGTKNLNIIVKADVGGSAEAVKSSLLKLSNDEVKVNVIHSAVGGINEGDVMLAGASNAIIVGFNVRPDKNALDIASQQGVDIRTYRIIYECIEEISAAMKGMLAPQYREAVLGHAEVRQTIHVPSVGTIAGCYILDGKVARNALIRVTRDSVVIFEDKISSLKRFKDDAKEVLQGFECGIGLEKFNDIKEGDILEAYMMEEIER